jgi:hypothetical protein
MFGSTATRSHFPMPRWSSASLTYATNMDEGLPPCTRPERYSVSFYRTSNRAPPEPDTRAKAFAKFPGFGVHGRPWVANCGEDISLTYLRL